MGLLTVVCAAGCGGRYGSDQTLSGCVPYSPPSGYELAARGALRREDVCVPAEHLTYAVQHADATHGRVAAVGCGVAVVFDCTCAAAEAEACVRATCRVDCYRAWSPAEAPTPAPPEVRIADATTPPPTVEQVTLQAQELYADGKLVASARRFARILELLAENDVNRAERENALLLAMEVYRQAEARLAAEDPVAAEQLMREAQAVYWPYVAEYKRAHGGAPGLEVQHAKVESTRRDHVARALTCDGARAR